MLMLQEIRRDFTVQAAVSGLVVVLVGMTSGAAIIFQAARAFGVSPDGASSWLGSMCLGIGISAIFLTLRFKAPVTIAWSTAGAALIATSASEIPLSEAIGAFLISAILVLMSGLTGWFERVMNRIPIAIAAALLAGVLLHFSLDSFTATKTQPVLIGTMLLSYLLSKRFAPRFSMLLVLIVGISVATALGTLKLGDVHFAWTKFEIYRPAFSIKALLGIAIPLFIVTMASQFLTGISVLRTNGFQTPLSPLLNFTAILNLGTAIFGGFSLCLAAVTAAIAVGPESHADRSKRYISALVSGFTYLLVGLACGTLASIFAAFPTELIMGIVGLALLTTIGSSLQTALADEKNRDAAFITFAVTASGVTLLGVNSAFWGIIAGIVTKLIFDFRKPAA